MLYHHPKSNPEHTFFNEKYEIEGDSSVDENSKSPECGSGRENRNIIRANILGTSETRDWVGFPSFEFWECGGAVRGLRRTLRCPLSCSCEWCGDLDWPLGIGSYEDAGLVWEGCSRILAL